MCLRIAVSARGPSPARTASSISACSAGEAAFADYSFGYRWEKEWGKLLLGIGGYYYHQFSDDKVNGITFLDGFRGRALGIGPQLQYQHPIGAILELKYQKDFEVENRVEGDRFIFRFLLRI